MWVGEGKNRRTRGMGQTRYPLEAQMSDLSSLSFDVGQAPQVFLLSSSSGFALRSMPSFPPLLDEGESSLWERLLVHQPYVQGWP